MNWSILLMECVILCVLFTVIVVTISRKNPLAVVHDLPPAIGQRAQELGLIKENQRSGSRVVLVKKIAEYSEKYGKVVRRIVTDPLPVSSSEIRQKLHAGKPVGDLLPAAVAAYIHDKHLYV